MVRGYDSFHHTASLSLKGSYAKEQDTRELFCTLPLAGPVPLKFWHSHFCVAEQLLHGLFAYLWPCELPLTSVLGEDRARQFCQSVWRPKGEVFAESASLGRACLFTAAQLFPWAVASASGGRTYAASRVHASDFPRFPHKVPRERREPLTPPRSKCRKLPGRSDPCQIRGESVSCFSTLAIRYPQILRARHGKCSRVGRFLEGSGGAKHAFAGRHLGTSMSQAPHDANLGKFLTDRPKGGLSKNMTGEAGGACGRKTCYGVLNPKSP